MKHLLREKIVVRALFDLIGSIERDELELRSFFVVFPHQVGLFLYENHEVLCMEHL